MAKLNQVYKCEICGNILEVVHEGAGQLVCCGQPMKLLQENAIDASNEKHVPVIEKTENGVKVKVGSIAHPMLPEHYIDWIEIILEGKIYKKFLKPGDKPQAEFCIETETASKIEARELCNLHGLWKS